MADDIPQTSDNKGTLSFVFGILSLFLPLVGIILGILAIVYWKKAKSVAPSGLATAGLVLGIVGLVMNTIVVFFFIIGFIAYFGVLQPDKLLPDQCTAQPPFSCTEYEVTGNNVALKFYNSGGIDLAAVSVQTTCQNGATQQFNIGAVPNAQSFSATPSCTAKVNERIRLNFTITYTRAGEPISHITTGKMMVLVRE